MLNVLLLIGGLFAAGLLLRHLWVRRLCVICFSIALTWLILLFLYKTNRWDDPVLLGLLLGQSICGTYYYLRRRLPKPLQIFTLPFFLTATWLGYVLITAQLELAALGIALGAWALAYLILVVGADKAKPLADKIIDCCQET